MRMMAAMLTACVGVLLAACAAGGAGVVPQGEPSAVVAAPTSTAPLPPQVAAPVAAAAVLARDPLAQWPTKYRRITVHGGFGCRLASTARRMNEIAKRHPDLFMQEMHDAIRRRACRIFQRGDMLAVLIEPGADRMALVGDGRGDQLWGHWQLMNAGPTR